MLWTPYMYQVRRFGVSSLGRLRHHDTYPRYSIGPAYLTFPGTPVCCALALSKHCVTRREVAIQVCLYPTQPNPPVTSVARDYSALPEASSASLYFAMWIAMALHPLVSCPPEHPSWNQSSFALTVRSGPSAWTTSASSASRSRRSARGSARRTCSDTST